jgi:hypothetical protein
VQRQIDRRLRLGRAGPHVEVVSVPGQWWSSFERKRRGEGAVCVDRSTLLDTPPSALRQ